MCVAATKRRQVFSGWLMCSAVLLLSACSEPAPDVEIDGNVEQGRALLTSAGCGSCHEIPGVTGAQGRVGPPLDQLVRRGYLAGILPNTPDNLVRWIADPQAIAPGSAMPDTGVTRAEAIDIAAYLYTLD